MKKWVLTASLGLEALGATESLSFSAIEKATGKHLIQVLKIENNEVTYVDLTTALKLKDISPFALFKKSSFQEQEKRLSALTPIQETIPYSQLRNPLEFREQHLCAGLNYSDHAAESGQKNNLVLFPKSGKVVENESLISKDRKSTLPELLDYEVELGVVFDRDIHSLEDLKSATAGLLVANDFSDRAPQIFYFGDVENHESYSFSAAKSKKDYTLVGPIVTIPKDWKAFSQNLEMKLYVNGGLKQSSSTSKMSLPIETMLKMALEDKSQKTWPLLKLNSHELDPQKVLKLLPEDNDANPYLPAGSLFLTGTPAGTLFQKPTPLALIRAAFSIPFTKAKLPNLSFKKKLKLALIERLSESGTYLKSGDLIESEISSLGGLRFSIE